MVSLNGYFPAEHQSVYFKLKMTWNQLTSELSAQGS